MVMMSLADLAKPMMANGRSYRHELEPAAAARRRLFPGSGLRRTFSTDIECLNVMSAMTSPSTPGSRKYREAVRMKRARFAEPYTPFKRMHRGARQNEHPYLSSR